MHKSFNKASVVLLILFLMANGCAVKKTKTEKKKPVEVIESAPVIQEPKVTEETIKAVPHDSETATRTVVDVLDESRKKVCLVLGPGLARGFVHAGIIEAFVEEQIPIHCIVGVGMGAMIGGLYSSHKNLNTLQWQLFKLRQELYLDFPFFTIQKSKISGVKLHAFLEENLDSKTLSDLPIKFATVAVSARDWKAITMRSSNAADAISASVAIPGVFKPWKNNSGQNLYSGMIASPLPADIAKSLGGNLLIGVSVLNDDFEIHSDDSRYLKINQYLAIARNISSVQANEFDYLVAPDLGRYSFNEFKKRTELISIGKKYGKKVISKIKDDLESNLNNSIKK